MTEGINRGLPLKSVIMKMDFGRTSHLVEAGSCILATRGRRDYPKKVKISVEKPGSTSWLPSAPRYKEVGLFTFEKVKAGEEVRHATSRLATLDIRRLVKAQWSAIEAMVKVSVTWHRRGKFIIFVKLQNFLKLLVTEDPATENFILQIKEEGKVIMWHRKSRTEGEKRDYVDEEKEADVTDEDEEQQSNTDEEYASCDEDEWQSLTEEEYATDEAEEQELSNADEEYTSCDEDEWQSLTEEEYATDEAEEKELSNADEQYVSCDEEEAILPAQEEDDQDQEEGSPATPDQEEDECEYDGVRARTPEPQPPKNLCLEIVLTLVLFVVMVVYLQQVLNAIDTLTLETVAVVLCMVSALAFAFLIFTLCRKDVGQLEVNRSVPEEEEEEEEEEDDLLFLRRRVTFLTEEELNAIELGRKLGRGGYGSVVQAVYQGTDAVIKVFLEQDHIHIMLKEARTAVKVDGAGGAPRVLALCEDPLAMVQEFVGETYSKFLRKCSVEKFLDSLVCICLRLQEMHDKGVVHNDLKLDNITYTGSVKEPVFHLIDFGWAGGVGRVATDFSAMSVVEADDHEDKEWREDEKHLYLPYKWMAPEVLPRRRVWPSGDVFSFGFMLQCLMEHCRQDFLTPHLRRVAELSTQRDPRRRSSLREVIKGIVSLKGKLLTHHLDQQFHFYETEKDSSS